MKDSLTESKEDEKQSISNDTVSQQSVTSDLEDKSPEAASARDFQSKVDGSEEMQDLSKYQDKISEDTSDDSPVKKPNNTGIPDALKTSIEQLSGYSLDEVRVHYNSDKPALLDAHAYAEGNNIYVAPGQEKHLAHEVWHVVQQMGGKVKATVQLKGEVPGNDSKGLEKDANVMGAKAEKGIEPKGEQQTLEKKEAKGVVQRVVDTDLVERFKGILKLKEVTVIEVPDDKSITLDTKFKDYPKENVHNIGAIKDKSLLDVNCGEDLAKAMRLEKDNAEYIASKAFDIVEMSGGGGYMHTVNTAMYNEGTANVERAILHEMGHAKQNEELDANFGTADQIILEYHNILLHENLFVEEEKGKDQAKRTKYGAIVKATSKSKDKTWKEFEEHATGKENKFASKNNTLIKGILKILASDETIKDEVKENLIIEYFNKTA